MRARYSRPRRSRCRRRRRASRGWASCEHAHPQCRALRLDVMRTLVDIPAAHLRCALEAGGWCVELVDEPDYWWCRQRWRLRSTRAPLDFEAYIAFLVDAEHRKDVERIWAL